MYGFQWRHFGAQYKDMHTDYTGVCVWVGVYVCGCGCACVSVKGLSTSGVQFV